MSTRKNNPRKIMLARSLRRSQNPAETILLSRLRNLQVDGAKFRRQQPIGQYIVDFIDLERKLIIEIDGGPHDFIIPREKDSRRTDWLEGEGYRILRFWNNDVLTNIEGVCSLIQEGLS